MLAADAEALACAAEASQAYRRQPETLARLTAPALLYAGDADSLYDGAKQAAAEAPDARFVALPGLNHGQASARGDLILPLVLPFLSQVTNQALPAS
jgi:pimeloyl-ACP methyl ester carboxylesterase